MTVATEPETFTSDIDFLHKEIMYNISVPLITDRSSGETFYIPIITVQGMVMNYDKEDRPPFTDEDDAFQWAFRWVKDRYK